MQTVHTLVDLAKVNLGLTIVEALTQAGYSAVLAGGAARDLSHGKSCKDIDVIVVPNEITPEGYSNLCQWLDSYGFVQKEGITDYEFGEGMTCRILGVFEQTTRVGEIDVVIYNPLEFTTAINCVKTGFDVNMNQYVIDSVVGESILTQYHGDSIIELALKRMRLIRNDISDTRRARLIEVAKELGWNYDCLVETTML